jgi:hypothetical protein
VFRRQIILILFEARTTALDPDEEGEEHSKMPRLEAHKTETHP